MEPLLTYSHSRVHRDLLMAFAASTGRDWRCQRRIRMAADVQGPVFVAGASGRVGQRIVRELAAAGIRVRAGVRDVSRGRSAIGTLSSESASVDFVAFNLSDEKSITEAIADSECIVSALGANEGLNPFAYAKVDGLGTARLMRTSARAKAAKQLVMVSSIGVGNPFGFPAALLNLFGFVLLWKEYAENAMRKAARERSISYFIVRPGGMERAGDDFADTHNIRLQKRGALSGGVISRLQVAKIVAAGILNPDAAKNKTVEAVAETTAPQVDIVTLLNGIRPD